MKPNVERFPIEIFGHCYDEYYEKKESALSALKQQYCKYIHGTCVKPRKSAPSIKVGICTLGCSVNKSKQYHPVIICPQRFKEERMFETVRQKYLSHWSNVKWVQEVNIGVGGNVDYVAVEIDKKNRVKDFLCIELQAAGTTGSPYPAVEELKEHGTFKSKSYNYGINWANEFTKTMMQQAYKKGKIVEHWNRKIVFVVQDIAMKYLKATSDCSLLIDSDKSLPVDFCSFKLDWEDHASEWQLHFDRIESTSIEGINRILGGACVEDYLTEKEFMKNIIAKGIADKVLPENTFL
jgi:hypothetical protein